MLLLVTTTTTTTITTTNNYCYYPRPTACHTTSTTETNYSLFLRFFFLFVARENIRVNALCPGPLATELLMKYLDTEEKKQRRLVHIPMGRFGKAEEIAKAALWLASDDVCCCFVFRMPVRLPACLPARLRLVCAMLVLCCFHVMSVSVLLGAMSPSVTRMFCDVCRQLSPCVLTLLWQS